MRSFRVGQACSWVSKSSVLNISYKRLVPDQILFAKYFNYQKIESHNFPYVFIYCFDQQNCIEIFSIEHYWMSPHKMKVQHQLAVCHQQIHMKLQDHQRIFNLLNIFQNVKKPKTSANNHLLDIIGPYTTEISMETKMGALPCCVLVINKNSISTT